MSHLCPPVLAVYFSITLRQFVSICHLPIMAREECSSEAETWQVKNILMKIFSLKFDVFVVSMATRTIE